MDKNRRYPGINVGIATVIVMFVAVALTIFAVLSLATATQEKKLADKFAASVSAYWAADAECAALADAFGAAWSGPAGEADVGRLAADCGAQVIRDGGDLLVSYSRPVGDENALTVTLRLGETFSIEEWRLVSADDDWNPDNSLPVWQG
jgi:Tfp pilus assembly protein PilX